MKRAWKRTVCLILTAFMICGCGSRTDDAPKEDADKISYLWKEQTVPAPGHLELPENFYPKEGEADKDLILVEQSFLQTGNSYYFLQEVMGEEDPEEKGYYLHLAEALRILKNNGTEWETLVIKPEAGKPSIESLIGVSDGKIYLFLEKGGESLSDLKDYLGVWDREREDVQIVTELAKQYESWRYFLDQGRLTALKRDGTGNTWLYGVREGKLYLFDEPEKEAGYCLGESFQEYTDYAIAMTESGVVFVADNEKLYRFEKDRTVLF